MTGLDTSTPASVAHPHRRYLLFLAMMFLIVWVILAIHPLDRSAWALENTLVVVLVLALAASYERLPFSGISYTMIFLFLCLHEIGAHYTYAKVPYDNWIEALVGSALNDLAGWERNHFDRLVHFVYGLLLAYPIREVLLRVANVRGFWGYFLPLDITMSTSMIFELFEWCVAELFGGDLGMVYLGIQGDVWDAHKDMVLASLGALAAMIVTAMVNICLQRDFAREWLESLRVKRFEPLGEDEIARLWRQRQ